MNVFARISRLFSTTAYFGLYMIFIGFVTAILAATPFAIVGAIALLYLAFRYVCWMLFYLVCNIEVSVQTVAGRSRLRTQNRRETHGNTELAYTEHITAFRTRESGNFVFEDSGYLELNEGDLVQLRLLRWSRRSKISEYDIIGYSFS